MSKNGIEIKLDRRNYRQHDERNKALIEKSLRELGAGRSVLLDSGNEAIAGNGVIAGAQKLGIPIRIIETDGTELIAIKRTDLDYDNPKRKQLAIMDNSTSDSSSFAEEILIEDFSVEELKDFGLMIETDNGYGTEFTLPNGDRAPFQQMTFTLADAQAERIKSAMAEVKVQSGTEYGNENGNGNKLHQIILEWAEQRK